jgi:hypothetical protein
MQSVGENCTQWSWKETIDFHSLNQTLRLASKESIHILFPPGEGWPLQFSRLTDSLLVGNHPTQA